MLLTFLHSSALLSFSSIFPVASSKTEGLNGTDRSIFDEYFDYDMQAELSPLDYILVQNADAAKTTR